MVLTIAPVSLLPARGAPGRGAQTAAAQKQIHLRFTRVLDGVSSSDCLMSSGRYLLVQQGRHAPFCGSKLWLINGRTGKRAAISVPRHTSVAGFAMPLVLFRMSRGYRLFNIRTRSWRPVACGPGCGDADGAGVSASLGTFWAEFEIQQSGDCGDGIHSGCGPAYANFSSTSSGRSVDHILEPGDGYGGIHGDPGEAVAADTVVDLDSRSHYRKVCSPVSISAGDHVKFFGQFVFTDSGARLALHRCRTGSTVPLNVPYYAGPSDIVGSNRVVLWQRSGPYIEGVMLPGVRRFTVRIPSAAVGNAQMAFAGRDLYLIDDHAQLLAARLL